ncbi:MAG: quinol dehydrogenase ferredoxin subunit NapH [Proteobacteria bacterium]|nr:quinol dehydrogenase ferredoxin subunit NapH [Pseudomonadota bacterium]
MSTQQPSTTTATPASAQGRPVRHFVMPKTLGGKLHVWRFVIARRFVQIAVLLLFFGTVHWGWQIAGQPLLSGNLSSSKLLGVIPLTDPFAVLQIVASLHWPILEAFIGAGVILLLYALLGGRVFCAWVCPVNMVADFANVLREKLGVRSLFVISHKARYWGLLLALVLSLITGVAAFEWVSPIGIMHRELIFGIGFGFIAILGVFVFDLLLMAHGWCGHICPLGAFWSIIGRIGLVKVAFDAPACTNCGDCVKVCPEPVVLNFKNAERDGMIRAGECTNCGKCVAVCPEKCLEFNLRARIGGASAKSAHTLPS